MMKREVISTDRAPQAVGPYSQAIVSDDLVFTAGQIGLDPATGQLVGESVEEQARQVMRNLQAVLAAAGVGTEQVLRATIYLLDMGEFAKVNEIYAELFANSLPARSTVEVSALPLGARVEIDLVARREH
jgi:2-iminobutanoate/2-iminopropanoate deaminase